MLRKIAPLFAIAAGFMWGSIGVFVRSLGGLGLDNITIVEVRMIGAALIMFLGILIYDRRLLRIRLKDSWIFVCAGLFSALGINYFYNIAINELYLSLAAILLSTMPVFAILLSLVLFGEHITLKKVGCMLMVICGCVFVSGILDGAEANLSVKGVIFGLMSGIGYALYSIFARVGSNRGYSALTINLYCFIVASLTFLFFSDWGTVGTVIAAAPVSRIGLFVLHSLICADAPYALFNFSMNHMDTGKASILVSCEPAAATIFGFLFFNEIPTVISVLGIAMVLVALALLSRPDKVNAEQKLTAEQKL